ncbi:MAG: phosphopantetheine-binding protein, partial [Thermoleophilia bacterium]|nr:phosphopantetheine-binding protein [Thermoleophilia bacterium]
DVSLRDQLDIDSMDLLNFVIGIHEQVHVDIPEADYARLQTLDEVVDYLVGKTAS